MKYYTRTAALAAFFALVVLPFLAILYSATLQEGSYPFERFFKAFSDVRMVSIIWRNILLAGSATLIASILAIPAAWISSRTNSPLAKTFPFLAIIPLLIPSHTIAYAWMQMMLVGGEALSSKQGAPLIQYFNPCFCAFVLAFYYFPIVFYGAYAAFRAADPLRENVALMYQPPWRVAWKIMLPAALPFLLASVALGFMLIFAEYGIPAMLTVNNFVGEIFVFMSAHYDTPSALALSLALFLFMVAMGWFIFRKLPTSFFFSDPDKIRPHTRFELGGTRLLAGAYLWLMFAITALVPLGALVIRAFALSGDPYSIEPSYFSGLKFFREGIDYARPELKTTMIITIATVVFSVLIALPIARIVAFAPRKLSYIAFVFCALMFLVPGTVFAVGMLDIYTAKVFDPIYSSPVIIIMGHVGRFTPLAVLILAAGMMRVGSRPEFVARLHGVSDLNAYLEVLLPSIKFEFLLAALAVVVFSISELGVTSLLSAAGVSTVTAALYIMMHYGNEERVSALSLIQIAMILGPVLLYAGLRFLTKPSGSSSK